MKARSLSKRKKLPFMAEPVKTKPVKPQKKLSGLIASLRSSSKRGDKVEVLKEFECDFLKWLAVASFDDRIFNVRIPPRYEVLEGFLGQIEFIDNSKRTPNPGVYDISELEPLVKHTLNFLESSKSHTQNKEAAIKLLSVLDPGSQELLLGVINKNWKCGVSAKTFNSIWPRLIPEFLVQLAHKYDPDRNYPNTEWIWSYKLDGLRCIALRNEDGTWDKFSRNGKKLITVDHLDKDLENFYKKLGFTFIDGELYLHGLKFEDIQGPVMANVNFKNKMCESLQYHIFVAGYKEEFLAQKLKTCLILYQQSSNMGNLVCVHQEEISDISKLPYDDMREKGYEGFMLRNPKVPYAFKRSHDLVKIKEFDSTDCEILEVHFGDFSAIVDGENKIIETMTKVTVKQPDGIQTDVGSGFTLEERSAFFSNPDFYVGKTIEVKHQGIGNNGSMRFPIFKYFREDK